MRRPDLTGIAGIAGIAVIVLVVVICVIMQIQYSTASCEELITYRAIGDLPGRCLYLVQGSK